MSTEATTVENDDGLSSAERVNRTESARKRSRAVEIQAIGIMWLGVMLALAGIVVLVTVGDKLFAGILTFGGAAIVLAGLLRGAYGHYVYWRMATG